VENLEDPAVQTLTKLITQGEQIFLVGVILQEILQGIREPAQFKKLRKLMQSFPILEIDRACYEEAARIYSQCRARGLQISTVDALITAASIAHNCVLLTSDQDFVYIAPHCGLQLLPFHKV
jgi:predicted nucleic acid-binding protein